MTISEFIEDLQKIENQDAEIMSIGSCGGSSSEHLFIIFTKDEKNYYIGKAENPWDKLLAKT